MIRPPISRFEFEEKNRRLLVGDASLAEADLLAWQDGRDWLAQQAIEKREGRIQRRSPRAPLQLTAHIGGVGRAVTEDVGFWGMRLVSNNPLQLGRGEEVSVRLHLVGRSVYVLGKVVWTDRNKLGLSLGAAHPADERALQAAVCADLLHRWGK